MLPILNTIEQIKDDVEAEGFLPGTEAFDERVIGKKVEKCQELRNTSCGACSHLDFCELAHSFRRIMIKRNQPK